MSSLSPELRAYYESILSREGGGVAFLASTVVFFIIAYCIGQFITGSMFQILALIVALILVIGGHNYGRQDAIHDRRKDVKAMPDDQLATAYAQHQKSAQLTGLFWAVAGVAVACGLLFTNRGNIFLEKFLNGIHQ